MHHPTTSPELIITLRPASCLPSPTSMLHSLHGDFSPSVTSPDLHPLPLHTEFLCPFSHFCPPLHGACPPKMPDHLPAGGAWHQRSIQADHQGPGGHSGSWLTESSLPGNADELRAAERGRESSRAFNLARRGCYIKRDKPFLIVTYGKYHRVRFT